MVKMCNMWHLLIILCFYLELTLSNYRLTWSEYVKMNKLETRTMTENHYRRKIYMKNFAKIKEHNDKFRQGLVSYSMKMNAFGHLTEEDFIEKYTGLVQSERNDKRRDKDLYYPPENVTLPATVDWRLQGAVTPVIDQNGCAACYAIVAVGTIESQYYIKSNKTIYLSKQQLVDCGGNHSMFGCNGGFPDGAYDYVNDIGLNTESKYPYEALTGPCRLRKHSIKRKIKSYKRIMKGSVYDMEAAVAFEGPVAAHLNASSLQFLSAKEILIDNRCNNDTADHGIIVVGYNTTPEGLNYWIIKNSWGDGWGDQGYFYVERYKDDSCGLADYTYIPNI